MLHELIHAVKNKCSYKVKNAFIDIHLNNFLPLLSGS
jgi:hypothetical protein